MMNRLAASIFILLLSIATAPAADDAFAEDDAPAADASPITGVGTPETGPPAAQEDS